MDTGVFMAGENKELELVRKGNALIEAKYKLTVHQQRILYALLETITPFDEDFKDYRLDIKTLAEKNGLEAGKALYKQIHEALKGLVGYVLEIKNDDETLLVAWLSRAKYREGRGYADISFDPSLRPYLLLLKSHYTEYPAIAVSGFKSSYSFRFYEWLQTFRYKGNGVQFYRVFTVQEIRDKMEIPKTEYPRFVDFKRRVIEPAMEEIRLYSDLDIVSVEYIKIGRAVGEVKITAEPKKQRQLAISEDTKDPNQIDLVDYIEEQEAKEKAEKEPKALQNLQNAGVGYETAKKWITKYGSKRIERNLAYVLAMKKTTEIKSFNAYLARAIMDDIADGWEDESEKARKAISSKEAEERKKQQEEEAERKREREEYGQYLAVFNEQDETMQDVVLDFMESEVSERGEDFLLKDFATRRAKGEVHTHPMFRSYFKKSMVENGLID
jgi:plasmid replication initiation protein